MAMVSSVDWLENSVPKHIGMVVVLKKIIKMSVRTSDSWSAHSMSTLPGKLCGAADFHELILELILQVVFLIWVMGQT